jgi:hypothetical protein
LSVVFTLSLAHASPEGGELESSSGTVEENLSASRTAANGTRLAKLLSEASFSTGVAEVAKMARSGADTAILIAHVQASDTPYKLRHEDIKHLDENNVPDSVIASMIVRGAEVRAKTTPAPQPVQPVQASQPSPAATVVYVSPRERTVRRPASTVTFIGGSCYGRDLGYRTHYYGTRDFYSGGYGRVHSSYGAYSYCGPSYSRSSWHRRGYGFRACR